MLQQSKEWLILINVVFQTTKKYPFGNNIYGSDSKESACNLRYLGLIPELGRYLGGEHDNPIQYSCLENPMDRGPSGLQSIESQRVRHY